MKYIIGCPNCGETDRLEMVDYNYFECQCGEDFDMERANAEEVE